MVGSDVAIPGLVMVDGKKSRCLCRRLRRPLRHGLRVDELIPASRSTLPPRRWTSPRVGAPSSDHADAPARCDGYARHGISRRLQGIPAYYGFAREPEAAEATISAGAASFRVTRLRWESARSPAWTRSVPESRCQSRDRSLDRASCEAVGLSSASVPAASRSPRRKPPAKDGRAGRGNRRVRHGLRVDLVFPTRGRSRHPSAATARAWQRGARNGATGASVDRSGSPPP